MTRMRIFHTAVIIVVTCCVLACTPVSGEGIWLHWNTQYNCGCGEVTATILARDVDSCHAGPKRDDITLTLPGWSQSKLLAEDGYTWVFTCKKTFSGAGEFSFLITADDANSTDCPEDDPVVTGTLFVTIEEKYTADPAISADEISGTTPGQSVMPGTHVTLSVSGHDTDTKQCGGTETDTCTYSWSATGGSFLDGSTGQSVTWIAPASDVDQEYTISVVIDDTIVTNTECVKRNDDSVTKTTKIAVSAAGEGDGGNDSCPVDGGCSSGTCLFGGMSAPMPGLNNMHAEPKLSGGAGGFGGVDTSNPRAHRFHTRQSGATSVLEAPGSGRSFMTEGSGGAGSYTLDNGTVIAQTGSDPASATYTITTPDGTVTEYGAPPSDQASSIIRTPLVTSITDPDGRTTTFSRVSGTDELNSVTLPNGDLWTYLHDNGTGDRRITRATAPDLQRTDITYVQTGPAKGKIATVSVYDSASTLLKSYTYTYDDLGRLSSAYDGTVTTAYEYNGNTVTVRQKDTSTSPETILSVIEYNYGNGTSDTTTVTKRDPAAPDTNYETTTYQFFTRTVGTQTIKTNLRKVTDALSKATTYSTYVSSGTNTNSDCTSTTNEALVGKVYKVTDARSYDTQYAYNTNGTPDTITYPGSSTQVYEYYTGTQWLRTIKNVRGNYTYYRRSVGSMHQVSWIKVDSANHTTDAEWALPATGTLLKSFAYYPSGDAHGQKGLLHTETVPGIDGAMDKVTSYEYWETVDSVEKLRNAPTKTTYLYWNGTSYENKSSTASYDSGGRMVLSTDANSRSIIYTYDNQGRPYRTIYQGTVLSPTVYTQNNYDCCHLKNTRDENGHLTHYYYDLLGRVTKTWTDIQSTGDTTTTPLVEYVYDGQGNTYQVKTRKDDTSAVRTTTYTYDGNNRVTQIDHPTGLGSEYFQYDDVGNMIGKKDGAGVVTAYEYDNLNRLTKVDYNHGSWPVGTITTADVTYGYAGGSRLRTSMADSVGTSSYAYDIQDRLETYTPPAPTSHADITYTYNNLGQKLSVANGTAVTTNYEYYANGWLKKVKKGASSVATYTYDAAGNRTDVALGNGASTAYVYDSDPRYRMFSITHTPNGGSGIPIRYQDRYPTGDPHYMQEWDPDTLDWKTAIHYDYDANSRLTSEGSTSFAYDWVGNRDPSSVTYNAADQLTATSTNQYTYLNTGSLEYRKNSSGTTIQKEYTYTYANLLDSVKHDDVTGTPSSSMTWDAAGNRITFTSSTDTSNPYTFVYDTTAGIPAVIEEVTPSGSVYYIREPDGSLVARISGSNTSYYHFDALGSTKLITNGSGTVTDKYTYDAWGKLTNHTQLTGSIDQPYQYIGQWGYYTHYQDTSLNDTNLTLLQLGVRFYDLSIGRFTQVDPGGEGVNSYVYVDDRPTFAPDVAGLFRWPTRAECEQYLYDMARLWDKIRRHGYGCPDPKHPGELHDLWVAWKKEYDKYTKGRCKERFKMREPQYIPEPALAPKKCGELLPQETVPPIYPVYPVPVPAPGMLTPAPTPVLVPEFCPI